MLARAKSEINLMGRFMHPNVIKSFEAFDHGDDATGKIYLEMSIGDMGIIGKTDPSTF